MKHQLDFEKPIIELQNKLDELRQHPEKHSLGISFEEEIQLIEKKLEETRRHIFLNLTPWQRVQLARHPRRPYTLDYIQHAFTDFHELHGDRLFAEDRAMVGGFARLGEHRVVVIGTQKGRDTKENILRNFGSAHPEGYRKALRLMRLADKFGLPIVTLIDTAGAYPGVAAEERHIAEAIAVNLREMMLLEVPIIAAVIGEGGSGGALALAEAGANVAVHGSSRMPEDTLQQLAPLGVPPLGLVGDVGDPKTGGNLGPVASALAFKPPKGVGLSVDAGVVTGGRCSKSATLPRLTRNTAATMANDIRSMTSPSPAAPT